MFDPKQEGTLAGTHAGKPGLPRGRSRLPAPAVQASQRERLRAAGNRFAELNARWHRRARIRHPDWPSVPDEAYQALAGATAELVRSWVSAGKTEALPELEDTLVALHLAVLAGRPWTTRASGREA